MCFMDDTVYVDLSWERLQNSINLGKEFFDIHDIKVNGSKCELIVINNSVLNQQDHFVTMGNNNTKVHASRNPLFRSLV